MSTRKTLAEKHSPLNEAVFQLKSSLLSGKRSIQNLHSPLKKFIDSGMLRSYPIVSFSESELWNPFDNSENWILTAGKGQNLRIAARRLNGVEVLAGEIFSFWKHIGNPNFGKGFVTGREVREGCIVPTIAGGLCQLSNALYDAALKAEFEIIERHRHTKVIKGSLAEMNRDATVKWNYIDLRFKAEFDFRIEVELSSDKLNVTFKGDSKMRTSIEPSKVTFRASNKLNDCYSCGNFQCFRHAYKPEVKKKAAVKTFVLDEKWPEFDSYIQSVSQNDDYFILPVRKNKLFKTDRYSWSVKNTSNIKYTKWAGVKRALFQRILPKFNYNTFKLSLEFDRVVAESAAKLIPVESTHLIVSQNLLPYLLESGALGGRTFDVLMTRLPAEKLHERLDSALSKYTQSVTLSDFRAPQKFIDLENKALTKAEKVITPHSEIAKLFINKVIKLNWFLPQIKIKECAGKKVLFPSSALGRKGAYEIKRLAKELGFSVVYSGKAVESENFWEGVKTENFTGNFDEIRLVVYPTYVEHNPRLLLKAISIGIPVITTTASGIEETGNIKVISIGNYNELLRQVQFYLKEEISS